MVDFLANLIDRADQAQFFAPPPGTARPRARYDSDVERILDLPAIGDVTPEFCDWFNGQHARGDFRFFPVQVAMIHHWNTFRGGFFPVNAGAGKTFASLAIAQHAFRQGYRKVMLLVPPTLVPQLTQRGIPQAREFFGFDLAVHVLHGVMANRRRAISQNADCGLFVLPYSLLQGKGVEEVLANVAPQLIIADEAHYLKNRRSARTRRLWHAMAEHEPRMVAMSGTITSRSIVDYAHIIRACLGDYSPLPVKAQTVAEWALVLDAKHLVTDEGLRLLEPVVRWANQRLVVPVALDQEGCRAAYAERLNTCPGVVVSKEDAVGATLIIENEKPEKAPSPVVLDLMRQVEEDWQTPDGDEIGYAIHKHAWHTQLTTGFYYRLLWPEPLTPEAEEILARAKEHHEARQVYHRLLRRFLNAGHTPGLDTDGRVATAILNGNTGLLPHELVEAYRYMRSLEFEGMPERVSVPVRLCDYKIRHAAEWARHHKRGIIWFRHTEVGRWLAEAIPEATFVPSGAAHSSVFLEKGIEKRLCIASYESHGTGKDLQFWDRQLFVQWPRGATQAEQTVARLHRYGQQSDEVVVTTVNSTTWDDMNMAACLNDSLFQQETTNAPRRLMTCNWNPLPRVFSDTMLNQQGFQVSQLTPEMRRRLASLFTIA